MIDLFNVDTWGSIVVSIEFSPIYISVPAQELYSRAAPSVGGYHHGSVGPITGRNPGGRQKKRPK